ncbi:MAG TPA: polymer-forming cytoskeletal protein [Ignavibacteriaceae bacterium]|nr:polymer-forming cytoskeletal protein [Ignavibacteriaceae bacterium]
MKNKITTPDNNEVTIISSGVSIEGTLSSNGNVRIDGIIEGDVKAHGNITIGNHGQIKGQVIADNIEVGGKILGTVQAKEKLVLEANSVLKGDIITKILIIASGAKFEGTSKMNLDNSQSAGAAQKSSEK